MRVTLFLSSLIIISSSNALVQLNKNRLQNLADDLGVTAFLQEAPVAKSSFAASPADLDSGDFEIKCQTTCGFAKSGAILAAGNGGGAAALEAAKSLAEVQDELKEVRTLCSNNFTLNRSFAHSLTLTYHSNI